MDEVSDLTGPSRGDQVATPVMSDSTVEGAERPDMVSIRI